MSQKEPRRYGERGQAVHGPGVEGVQQKKGSSGGTSKGGTPIPPKGGSGTAPPKDKR